MEEASDQGLLTFEDYQISVGVIKVAQQEAALIRTASTDTQWALITRTVLAGNATRGAPGLFVGRCSGSLGPAAPARPAGGVRQVEHHLRAVSQLGEDRFIMLIFNMSAADTGFGHAVIDSAIVTVRARLFSCV